MYTLYIHIFPNNKVYVGITQQKPTKRWQNGKGYVEQDYIYKAILKYGWNNIQHQILHENLSLEEACELEKYYITTVYHSNDRNFGYNIDLGGTSGNKMSEETRKKLSELNKGPKNPMYGKKIPEELRQKTSERFKKIPRTKEWYEKISKSLKGKKPSAKTREIWSKHRKGRKWWNNGIIQTQSFECPEGYVPGMLKKKK